MSIVLRLSLPNLAGILAIAAAPFLTAVFQPRPAATPLEVVLAPVAGDASPSLSQAIPVDMAASDSTASVQ